MKRLLRRAFRLLYLLHQAGPLPIVASAVAVALAGVAGFQREAALREVHLSWHEALYYTMGLFAVEGNPFGYPRTHFLQVIYFLAPFLTASAVVGAVLKLLEERAPNLLGHLREHTVIGGLGRLGSTIARSEERDATAHVAIERDVSAPGATDLRGSLHGHIVLGDLTSAEILRRAGCHRARNVFFTAASDAVNLDAAFLVRRLARQHPARRPPAIFAHVFDAGLAEALEPQLRASAPGEANITPFNSYRFAAKALLAILLRERLITSLRVVPGLCLERTTWPEGDPQIHEVRGEDAHEALAEDRRRLLRAFYLCPEDAAREERYAIIGLGRFGRSVLGELLGAVSPRARFLLVERESGICERQLGAFRPEERGRFEVLIGDASSPGIRDAIEGFRPRAVLLCTDQDLGNLRVALELHRHGVRTITRMFDLEAASELGRGLEERGVITVGLARLFRAAIPILTHERSLRACLNLDIIDTPEVDHLFYLAAVTPEERRRLGPSCVGFDELPAHPAAAIAPADLALVWYRAVSQLGVRGAV